MKKIFLALAATAMFVGCSKTDSVEIESWDGELRITSGIETRASGTTWQASDSIGVFMSTTATTTAIGLHNTKYTTTSSSTEADFTVDSEFTDLYYPQSGSVDVVAHYPYSASATLSTYPVSVATQTNLPAIDLMSAKVIGVAKSKTALDLKFYHLLSQLKVTLSPASGGGLTASDLATASVKVSGSKVAATATIGYDATEGQPTASFELSGDEADLSLAATSSVATFILVPQTADLTFTISVSGYGDFVVDASAVALTSGDEHTYTISVSRTEAKITGNTISPWGDGEEGDDSLYASDFIVDDDDPIVFVDAKFKAALLSNTETINTNGDSEISYGEAKAFSGFMYVTDLSVSYMNELVFFPNLTSLYCSSTAITSLDISGNPALTYLSCSNTSIESLDLSNNSELTTLLCSNTSISELDLSGNPALTSLKCNDNFLLISLKVSGSPALTSLECNSTSISELDLRGNPALTELECYSTSISELDLSGNPALTSLSCNSTSISELDLSYNTALTSLYCYSSLISSLTLTDLKDLKTLQCYDCRLSSLDISSCDNVGLTYSNQYSSSYLMLGNQTSDGTTSQELTLTISAAQSTSGLTSVLTSIYYNYNITTDVQGVE